MPNHDVFSSSLLSLLQLLKSSSPVLGVVVLLLLLLLLFGSSDAVTKLMIATPARQNTMDKNSIQCTFCLRKAAEKISTNTQVVCVIVVNSDTDTNGSDTPQKTLYINPTANAVATQKAPHTEPNPFLRSTRRRLCFVTYSQTSASTMLNKPNAKCYY